MGFNTILVNKTLIDFAMWNSYDKFPGEQPVLSATFGIQGSVDQSCPLQTGSDVLNFDVTTQMICDSSFEKLLTLHLQNHNIIHLSKITFQIIELKILKIISKLKSNNMKNTYEKYKRYQLKYLPQYSTVEGYEVPDFDPEAYNMYESKLDKISMYLEDLRPYVKHLVQAAQLRQKHFEEYIEPDPDLEEDPNHEAFRKAFNLIAQDGLEKLDYWSKISDKLFDKHLEKWEKIVRNRRPAIDRDIINRDFKPEAKSTHVVSKPKLTQKEKRKRRKARRARRLKKERESEQALKALSEESDISDERWKAQVSKLPDIYADVIITELGQAFKDGVPVPSLKQHLQLYRIAQSCGKIICISEMYYTMSTSPKDVGMMYGELLGSDNVKDPHLRVDELSMMENTGLFLEGIAEGFLIAVFKDFMEKSDPKRELVDRFKGYEEQRKTRTTVSYTFMRTISYNLLEKAIKNARKSIAESCSKARLRLFDQFSLILYRCPFANEKLKAKIDHILVCINGIRNNPNDLVRIIDTYSYLNFLTPKFDFLKHDKRYSHPLKETSMTYAYVMEEFKTLLGEHNLSIPKGYL